MPVFGRLTVIGSDRDRSKPGRTYVKVRCACGTVKSVRKDALTSGATVSCGCKKATHGLKHGHRRIGSKDPTYQAWDGMVQRCTNSKAPHFKDYGGRGIQVCSSWLTFSNFLEDMGVRPEGAELNRVNNNIGYFKGNCNWVSRAEQMLNTRRTIMVDYEGEIISLTRLCRLLGKDERLVRQRYTNGWSVEKALTTERRLKNAYNPE